MSEVTGQLTRTAVIYTADYTEVFCCMTSFIYSEKQSFSVFLSLRFSPDGAAFVAASCLTPYLSRAT